MKRWGITYLREQLEEDKGVVAVGLGRASFCR